MKIKRISWQNYRGLADGEIFADGADVIVRGQNGVGKTSIASIVPYVLFPKRGDLDKIRYYEDGLTLRDDGVVHSAEVEFEDGTVLRREVDEHGRLYVDGDEVKEFEYNAHVDKLTRGGGKMIFNPFEFCEMKPAEQRELLMKHFGKISDKEILGTPEFAEMAKLLGGQSVDIFINAVKRKIFDLKNAVKKIPPQIEAWESQLADMPLDPKVTELMRKERDALFRERSEIYSAKDDAQEKLNALKIERERLEAQDFSKQVTELEIRRIDLERQHSAACVEVENLREEYRAATKAQPDTCPTCGQKFPPDMAEQKRKEHLGRINTAGQVAREKRDSLRKKISQVKAQSDELRAKPIVTESLAALDKKIAALEQEVKRAKTRRQERLAELDREISEFDKELTQMESVADVQKRIADARAKEKQLNQEIVDCECQLAMAKDFVFRKTEILNQRVSGHFEHVRFKLFNVTYSTGEAKTTCEAMLDGVPYSELSKGERLKVALDIFRALQKKFGVELPLMIDDAESYTRNSFVDVPNQLWLFKVSDEEQLVIEVKKEARRVA